MTNEELDRLADAIVRALEKAAPATGAWLPTPVRPEPPGPAGEPPAWAAAAQRLGDVAPIRHPEPSTHRDDIAAATPDIRAAAAGQGTVPARGSVARSAPRAARGHAPRSNARGGAFQVSIGISNRHVHLSADDATALFGPGGLTTHRALTQPGQFAAEQRVAVVGPSGRIEGIRVVGPARGATQLEIAMSDAAALGVAPPVANSGMLSTSAGGVTLEGPRGRITLTRGVIVAARHLHLSPADARRHHLADGDTVAIRCGVAGRETTWHGVLVRSGDGHATEFHLDVDEGRAAGVTTGDIATVVAHAPARTRARPLVTEHDVLRLAARGEPLPPNALLTPSARDRARALGLATP
ncbi:MAG: hypothetical protein JNJ98_05045 [Gemmatimonadetes bacterium]|nr:hypothetical protein [Gemmatimonadota bacterium]